MKKLRNALALLLTLSLLLGMPLSINVAATGTAGAVATQQTAKAVQALLIPDSWNTGHPADRSIQLYFNCEIQITDTPLAYLALVDSRGLCRMFDPLTGDSNTGSISTIWEATYQTSSLDHTVIFNLKQSRNYHPNCDTVSEILDLAQKLNLTPVVRLREADEKITVDGAVIQYPNNTLAGLNVGTTGQGLLATNNGVDGGGCLKNGQVRLTSGGKTPENLKQNCFDYIDIPITTVDHGAPTLSYVECNGTMIRPIFSEAMYWDTANLTANPTHLRVVNSKGQVVYTDGSNYSLQKNVPANYYPLGNYDKNANDTEGLSHTTFFTNGASASSHSLTSVPYHDGSRNWAAIYNDCVNACAALNQNHFLNDTYTVALVIEEDPDCLTSSLGETTDNHRIDRIWTKNMVPLTATHSDEYGDRVVVPLCTSSQIEQNAAANPNILTLKSVTIHSVTGLADRVLIEFSKPVTTIGYKYAGIRLYASSGWVPTVDSSAAQWPVIKWEKYNAEGTQWIGEIDTKYECNTLAGIENFLVSKGYAVRNGQSITMQNGSRLEFALVGDNTSVNDRVVSEMHAADGSPLFANDSPLRSGNGEDRASVPYSRFNRAQSVTVEDVTIYANRYVLINFSQDVTWNLSLFYNGLCVYDQKNANLTTTNGTDYAPLGTSGYTTNLQKSFTSWSYYGNRKDIVVATLASGHYEWLTDHLTKANAWAARNGDSADRFTLSLRLQDLPDKLAKNNDKAVDGITALASDLAHLYAPASGNYSTVYHTATFHENEGNSANLVQARILDTNRAVLSFSTPITAVDSNAIRLVDGNTSYPVTVSKIDGPYLTVTFNNVTLHDGMGFRISGGADYRIPASVVTTENGSVIYANETDQTAYIHADMTEAVATLRHNDTYYINFSSVWKNQQSGDTITLYRDVDLTTSTLLVLSSGVTLDLNGHTLTIPYFFSFGHVIDSRGGGLLAMSDDGIHSTANLQSDNRQLPLYDASHGGYRFFAYDIENLGTKQSKDSDGIITAIKYGIRLHFTDESAYALLRDAKNSKTTLTMDIVLRFPNKTHTQLTYTFAKQTLATFATLYPQDQDKAITLTVKGMKNMSTDALSQPTALLIDTHSTLKTDCGVEHDSTAERTYIGITPAQSAVNWITARIENNDLVSFTYNNNKADLSTWTMTESGDTITAQSDWSHSVTYTNSDKVSLTIDITFNKEHASLEWVGNWKNSGSGYSKRISNVRILNASFPITGAVMTTARQGGQMYIYDYQPYSVDLTKSTTSMQNSGGRSSQGAWPYFDLTSEQNTHGIMGAIGWSGNWTCEFAYDAASQSVNVSAGMQKTGYQMKRNEELRTPSMVIQFFNGTQDDGHNAFRQLILDEYTPDNVNTYGENNTPCAPISLNTWGGWGTDKMIETLNTAKNSNQYFEYQWIDAGWYGDYTSNSVSDSHQIKTMAAPDSIWHTQRGSWYYNPGYTTSDSNRGKGGFDKINEWHQAYQAATGRDIGLIVWFEPSFASPYSVMAENGSTSFGGFIGGYTNPITGKKWNNDWFFTGYSEIDYGIPDALAYVKALVLHYLDDMNADYYRQDFNSSNMTARWNQKDTEQSSAYTRHGVAEIQYVTAHYDLLDTVLNAGYMIDNCASGGRMLDIEMMKRSIPLWRTDYSGTTNSVASGIRSQGANIAWWLPISGSMSSAEGLTSKYTFRSSMASGITLSALSDATFANTMFTEMRDNRELMLGDYYILQQGLHEGLKMDSQLGYWVEDDPAKDYTNAANAAYEFYREDLGKGYLVAFRPTYSNDARDTVQLKGLDAHADYRVTDADTGESALYTGRYLMEQGLDLRFDDIRTSHMIYFEIQ